MTAELRERVKALIEEVSSECPDEANGIMIDFIENRMADKIIAVVVEECAKVCFDAVNANPGNGDIELYRRRFALECHEAIRVLAKKGAG